MSNFRSDFHAELAQLVLDDIQYQRSKYYYFLGRVDKWDDIDETPPTPEDNQHENTVIRSNMIFAKRIAPSDISVTARRYDWELGNVYDQWDHTDDMRTKRFFVLTDEESGFRVYKCLDNANGSESSIQPTGTAIAPVRLEDGYLWKYMYSIPTFKRSRFVTANNMPVQRALTDNFFNRGEIEQIVVTNKGSNYIGSVQTTIVVNDTGKTTGSGATGTLVRGVIGNITGVNIVLGGTGYTKGVKIDITTTTGSGAMLSPVITGGVVTGVTVIQGGIGYAAGDTITFRVGGAVIIPKLNSSGTLTGAIIRDPGIGYNLPPTLTLSGALGQGTGKFTTPTGTGTAIINAVIFGGAVQIVSIVDPGIGYPVGTSVVVTIQGDGANAAATPVVYNGEIVDIILDNPGSGYSFTIINVDEPGNALVIPATVVGLIDQSDYESDQSIIEQTAVPGAIYSIGIADSGNGYSQNTTITIEGDGTGATATCEVLNGEIVRTQVTNFGSGYSYANVIINDPATTPGAGAELYAILPPVGGHGTNAPVELYGDTLILNSQLRNEIVATAIDQDFRQFGILKNPRDAFSFANFTEEAALILYKTVFTDVTGLLKDEVLIQGGNRFVVADIDGITVYLLKLNQTGTLITGELLTESDPTRDYDCSLIVSTPNFNKYTGSLIYISNEAPFTFTPEQGIIIKTLIQF